MTRITKWEPTDMEWSRGDYFARVWRSGRGPTERWQWGACRVTPARECSCRKERSSGRCGTRREAVQAAEAAIDGLKKAAAKERRRAHA
jgi:hypothetical protein